MTAGPDWRCAPSERSASAHRWGARVDFGNNLWPRSPLCARGGTERKGPAHGGDCEGMWGGRWPGWIKGRWLEGFSATNEAICLETNVLESLSGYGVLGVGNGFRINYTICHGRRLRLYASQVLRPVCCA